MINLEKKAGIPIFLTKNNKLTSKLIKIPKPEIRTFEKLKNVLLLKKTAVKNFYYMYRNIAPNPVFLNYSLRYDITIIPPNKIGNELVKTLGHYHKKIKNKKISYPEVYQVIHGEAFYLLQKKEGEKIKDVILAKAKEGDIIVVPPNYGHVTINPSNKTLVMANIVYASMKSDYKEIEKKHGACYYVIKKKNKIIFVKNQSYKDSPKIRFKKPTIKILKSPIYNDCTENPNKYLFLIKPEKFKFDI
ncbi:MAG: glucose-6-phosphate isomerase family protein [Candidatus Woesearchaeota archaeon]